MLHNPCEKDVLNCIEFVLLLYFNLKSIYLKKVLADIILMKQKNVLTRVQFHDDVS